MFCDHLKLEKGRVNVRIRPCVYLELKDDLGVERMGLDNLEVGDDG